MTRVLAFCDPGLDRVSIAIFRYETGPRQLWDLAPMQNKIEALVGVRIVKTDPKDALANRLLLVARGVRDILVLEKPERLYVEIPRVAGNYARHSAGGYADGKHGKFQIDMQFTHYATGAIICSAGTVLPGRVDLVNAMSGKKDRRIQTVRDLLVVAGRREEIRNQDDLDAIALGIGTTWPR